VPAEGTRSRSVKMRMGKSMKRVVRRSRAVKKRRVRRVRM
jgi:hypothetical protein